ncbi:hypothetical protein STEG23_010812 [Scotinomys teguina]
MVIPKDGLQNLANTLEGDKDLNSPRELSAEAEKELAIVEKTIREAHVDRVNPELKCILVILPSRHSPTGILMQREDVILEWIFLPRKPNKKLKSYIEKISDLIHKGMCECECTSPQRTEDGVRFPESIVMSSCELSNTAIGVLLLYSDRSSEWMRSSSKADFRVLSYPSAFHNRLLRHKKFHRRVEGVDEVTHQAKEVIAAKPDDLSSIPGTHIVEEQN